MAPRSQTSVGRNSVCMDSEVPKRPLLPLYSFLIRGLALWLVLSVALPMAAQTPTLTTLHSFGAGSDGSLPEAALLQGTDGNFYGTTAQGGTSNYGTVFKITPSGSESVLYSFAGGSDGEIPLSSLVEGADGNFYGTTKFGGASNKGTVFKITPAGSESVLYSFAGGSDGAYPSAGLILGADGDLYGTTYDGGSLNKGTVFKVTTAGVETLVYVFEGGSDGANPLTSLLLATDGTIYGTTYFGGSTNGFGTLFRKTPNGGAGIFYHFGGGSDGAQPYGSLIQGSDGKLYGTTEYGGTQNMGTVYTIIPGGSDNVLHAFGSGSDGQNPNNAGLVEGADGNFYGTTERGGAGNSGTVYVITSTGSESVLHAFTGGSEGAAPLASLIQGADGYLYGCTVNGGTSGLGTVFRLSGVYPVPNLKGLGPGSRNAGSPAFTLKVKGASFQTFSNVRWNGSPLVTTYVSGSALNAAVPTSLIASPGKATITVVTEAGGGTSNTKTFTILLTTLHLAAANLVKNSDGSYTANLALKNVGYNTAPGVSITKATLNAVNTTTALPLAVGSIAAGKSGSASLAFPSSAGTSGMVVSLKVYGTFTGGKFSGSLRVLLP